MSRPVKEKSISAGTAAGTGTALELGGRITVSLFVVTDADPTTLDVELQVTMDGENWATYVDAAGNAEGALTATEFSDPGGNGNFAAFATIHGLAAQAVRAAITDYGTAGNVDAWVSATNNPASSYDYRDTGG